MSKRAVFLDRDGTIIDDTGFIRRVEDVKLVAGGGYKPRSRQRPVSVALRAYAAMALSADKGAVRDVSKLEG